MARSEGAESAETRSRAQGSEGGVAAWERAVAQLAALASGPPMPADLDVTVHFHPDRMVGDVVLLRHLVADGFYRSQFETGTSNGGLTAYPGGDRWLWEQRLFGGAYDREPATERPKYGALNYRRRPAGGSVRFGSSHLRLAREAVRRTTFCYPDSVMEPTDFGTTERFSLIELAEHDHLDPLDDHIEAHVHGPLRLAVDVDAVVLDPSFRGTEVEAAARELPFVVEWHHGFRLHVDELAEQVDYRGPEVVAAGRAIAVHDFLDARVIGEAVRAGRFDPQTLKRVWHCTARFGSPAG